LSSLYNCYSILIKKNYLIFFRLSFMRNTHLPLPFSLIFFYWCEPSWWCHSDLLAMGPYLLRSDLQFQGPEIGSDRRDQIWDRVRDESQDPKIVFRSHFSADSSAPAIEINSVHRACSYPFLPSVLEKRDPHRCSINVSYV
jgi:hypothetical protein